MRAVVRQAAYIRQARCHCGRLIVANDRTQTVSHEAPECAWFEQLVAGAGPSAASVELLDPETGERKDGRS